jgi:uncharacterized protein YjbI with pentapeptide repeats
VANEEHVKRLKQSVAEWNEWRKEEGALRPDLGNADLSYADLSYADLSYADLSKADLSGADLRDVNLSGADLSYANLNEACLSSADLVKTMLFGADLDNTNLTGSNLDSAHLFKTHLIGATLVEACLHNANLEFANLSGADLHGANLSSTDLFGADLTGAKLAQTNLTFAKLHDTIFGTVDLSSTVGLKDCKHLGPSIIDHKTLQKSGPLPLEFLRGVGLPDRLIEYLPSLLGEAIQYYSCFISYSTKDQDFASRIHADLQNNGVRCWFAPHDLKIGDDLLDVPDAAIRVRDKVLLILSENSIGSGWVKKEVTAAFDEEDRRKTTVLFPVRLDDGVMETNEAWAAQLRHRLIGDFRHWKDHDGYKQAFERVLRDLKRAAE